MRRRDKACYLAVYTPIMPLQNEFISFRLRKSTYMYAQRLVRCCFGGHGGLGILVSKFPLWQFSSLQSAVPGQSKTSPNAPSPHGETLGMHVPEARISSKLGAVFFLDESVIL